MCRVLGVGCWCIDYRVLGVEYRVLGIEHRVLGIRYTVYRVGSWVSAIYMV